jgi:CspA family cold shock protein
MEQERKRGQVKWFNSEKGYGFISIPNENDIFVHIKALIGGGFGSSLEEGQEVEFSIEQGRKGLEAREVKII